MYDYNELIRLIEYKCGTHERFAQEIGIGRVALSQKLNNRSSFSQEEIARAVNVLELKNSEIPRYFFTVKVRKAEL